LKIFRCFFARLVYRPSQPGDREYITNTEAETHGRYILSKGEVWLVGDELLAAPKNAQQGSGMQLLL
jgi:hypothetical protein